MRSRVWILPIAMFVIGILITRYAWRDTIILGYLSRQQKAAANQFEEKFAVYREANSIGDALVHYAKQHGDHLPPLTNWQESVKPYVIPYELRDKLSEYKYFPAVAGKKLSDLKGSRNVILLETTQSKPDHKIIRVYFNRGYISVREWPPSWSR